MGKKQQTESVNSKLALVMKSGKAVLGYKSTLKALRKGSLKAIFVAHNTPSIIKAEINYPIHMSTIIQETTLTLAQPAEDTIELLFLEF